MCLCLDYSQALNLPLSEHVPSEQVPPAAQGGMPDCHYDNCTQRDTEDRAEVSRVCIDSDLKKQGVTSQWERRNSITGPVHDLLEESLVQELYTELGKRVCLQEGFCIFCLVASQLWTVFSALQKAIFSTTKLPTSFRLSALKSALKYIP